MGRHYLRMTFYGRDIPIHIGIGEVDYEDALTGIKALAAGRRGTLPAFFLFPVSSSLSVLLSVAEVQTIHFTREPDGEDWAPQLNKGGVAFYLKGQREPLVLDYSGRGPLDDMFHGLADTAYGDEIPGCIMLSDGAGEPVFFRLDEIQYAVVRTELIQKPS